MNNSDIEALSDVLEALVDTSDLSEEEVQQELREAGIDVKGAHRRLNRLMDDIFAARAMRSLESRKRPPTTSSIAAALESVRQMLLPVEDLVHAIAALRPQVEHRELRQLSRADLETQYAELLALTDADEEEQ